MFFKKIEKITVIVFEPMAHNGGLENIFRKKLFLRSRLKLNLNLTLHGNSEVRRPETIGSLTTS